MTSNPENFRPRAADGSRMYLESAIRTASPARLRLMLIQRAIEVAVSLARVWREGQSVGPNEYSLTLMDLLGELLAGVAGSNRSEENAVCEQVADLYVFLNQHLLAAETHSDAASIDEIRTILEIEAETWRAVCASEASALPANAVPQHTGTQLGAASGLNFSA